MAAILPPIPRIVFSVIEPISLVAGFCGTMADPAWFIAEQVPQATPVAVNENSIVVALQLGNLYLLMAFMGVAILYSTSEAKVVQRYLFALWLGDIGHVGLSAYSLGQERLKSPWEWNAVTQGNVAFTVFLFVMRSAYFLGIFGPDRAVIASTKKRS